MKVNYKKLFFYHFYIRLDFVDAIFFAIWLTFWPKRTLRKYPFMIECISGADVETQMLAVKDSYLLSPGFDYDFDEEVHEWIYANSGVYDKTWLAKNSHISDSLQLRLAKDGYPIPPGIRKPKTEAYYKMIAVLNK